MLCGSEATSRLGAEHPDALLSVNHLAGCLQAMGLLKDAELLRTLGAEHPRTVVSVSNLARCLKVKGQLKDALRVRSRASKALL